MPKVNSSDDTPKQICTECGKSSSGFYKSSSDLYSNTGTMPVCKDCAARRYEFYKIKYLDSKMAMQRFCMAFDLYYNDEIFESVNDNSDKVIGAYMKKMNMKQFRIRTFDTTLAEGFFFDSERGLIAKQRSGNDEEDAKSNVDPILIKKWGAGLPTEEDYDTLEEHYNFLKSANPHCDGNQEIFIRDLCYTKMQQLRAIRDKDVDSYNKLTESYRKTFQGSGLKAGQETDTNSDDCWGAWMERIERYTPAEYYKNKQLYKDADGLGDYFTRHVLRPLRNLMHGTQDRDSEYCVKDEDGDYDGYTDAE